jgi:hypothetical protein
VTHTCNPRYLGGRDQKDHFRGLPKQQLLRPYLENIQHKKGWWMAQMPSKHKDLSSNPSTAQKNTNKKTIFTYPKIHMKNVCAHTRNRFYKNKIK